MCRVKDLKQVPIIEQILLATQGYSVFAFLLGLVINGSIPIATYVLAHYEVQENPWMWIGVGFGGLFSVVTVYAWGIIMFQSKVRSVGYCMLAEIGMIFASINWLCWMLLGIVVFINGISGGCAVVLDWKQYKEREEGSEKESVLPEEILRKPLRRGEVRSIEQ